MEGVTLTWGSATMDNHWGVKELPEGAVGFIYRITLGKKFYIGKKRCVTITRKRQVKPNHAWKKYTGSSKDLNEDLKKTRRKPKFEILQWCGMLSELNYAEVHWQVITGALRDPNSYNKQLGSGHTMYHANGWWMDDPERRIDDGL